MKNAIRQKIVATENFVPEIPFLVETEISHFDFYLIEKSVKKA